ncbi:MAG: SsrA-binding protein SmpB [Eubacteriaceae bacterium]|nr:SsrA-binding protein SmpB [Eubacteriaceae bacterium]
MKKGPNTIALNRKARHDFSIEETYEVGIELFGTEVKSIRAGKVNLKDSYADIKNGEMFVFNMHISPYEQGNIFNKDPLRIRKLLMHKAEIRKLFSLKQLQGYTLVPLSLYFSGSNVKMELALAKGKKTHDKRHDIAERDAERRILKASRVDSRNED